MKTIISITVCICFITSCKQNISKQEKETGDTLTVEKNPATDNFLEKIINEEAEEANYNNTSSNFKKVYNERFGFSFEVPAQWKAVDKSNNGDGYFLETGNASADVRIFGANIEGNEVLAEMEIKSCNRTEKFSFADGNNGIKCFQGKDIYYYYDTKKLRITCYIKGDEKWIADNNESLMRVVKSITVSENPS